MNNKKFKIFLSKKNFFLLFNNKLIYSQILLNLKKKPLKLSRSSLFYWIMLIYIKRLGLIK